MRVLVTGGTGYVGSHVCVELLDAGHEVVIVDNLANSRNDVLERIASIAGRRPRFLCLDIRHGELLRSALRPYRFDGAIHAAGLRSTEASVAEPADYYRTNVTGAANVIDAVGDCAFVHGSAATVYGEAGPKVREDDALAPANPYGRSMQVAEMVVRDVVDARGGAACLLRRFNAAGAHESGRLGQDPRGAPGNLMPVIEQVAVGVRERLCIYGDDYPTADGTAVRDYVHVMDLARAHRLALERLVGTRGVRVYNLGSGHGRSVLEVVGAFERATGRSVPYRIEARRRGDVAQCSADASRARAELGWSAERGLATICADSLRWRRYWLDSLRPLVDVAAPEVRARRWRTRPPRRRSSAAL